MTEQATELSAIDFTDDEKQVLELTAELIQCVLQPARTASFGPS